MVLSMEKNTNGINSGSKAEKGDYTVPNAVLNAMARISFPKGRAIRVEDNITTDYCLRCGKSLTSRRKTQRERNAPEWYRPKHMLYCSYLCKRRAQHKRRYWRLMQDPVRRTKYKEYKKIYLSQWRKKVIAAGKCSRCGKENDRKYRGLKNCSYCYDLSLIRKR